MYRATIFVEFSGEVGYEFELDNLNTNDKSVIGDIAWEAINDNMDITIIDIEEM